MLCLTYIKVTYVPVRPCTVSCARTAHCTSSAILKLMELLCRSELISAQLMTVVDNRNPKADHLKMSEATGEIWNFAGLKVSIGPL